MIGIRMERKLHRKIGEVPAVMQTLYQYVMVKEELFINSLIYVASLTLGHEIWGPDRNNKIKDTSGQSDFASLEIPRRAQSSARGRLEPLLNRIEKSQIRWFCHPIKEPPRCHPCYAFEAHGTGRRPWGMKIRTKWLGRSRCRLEEWISMKKDIVIW